MMDYSNGYTASFYATIVDPLTWMDGLVVQIESGSVKRQEDGIRQSAEITVQDFPEDEELYLRIYMDSEQNGDTGHEAIFTGLASVPAKDIDGAIIKFPLQLYSVLQPLADTMLPRGYYIPAGMTVGVAVRRLLEGIPAPYEIEDGSPALTDFIVAMDNDSRLSMMDAVLEAADWRCTIDGNGVIHIGAKPRGAKIRFSPDYDMVEKTVSVKRDWFGCPNVLRANSGDMVAVARDDDPESMLSTVSRGREVVKVESSVNLADDEGIAEYAERRLKELQATAESVEYDRWFVPTLNIGDKVEMGYDQIQGVYTITEQTIELGGLTSETVERSMETFTEEEVEMRKRAGALLLPDYQYLIMPDNKRLTVPIGIDIGG